MGQLGLGAIVVDVIGVDDGQFRRVARLAGAQDDPAFGQFQFVADIAHQFEAGLRGFHDHVQQRHGDIGMLTQLHTRFLGVVGMHQMERPVENPQIV